MVIKYNYVPEESLEKRFEPLVDGMCKFEVRKIIPDDLDQNKEKVEFLLTDNRGTRGVKLDTFSEKTLWKLVALLKAVGRMDLYSNKGVTDLTQLIGMSGYLILETKFDESRQKSYQNIKAYVEKNGHHDSVPHHSQQAKSEIDKSWEDTDDEIPF